MRTAVLMGLRFSLPQNDLIIACCSKPQAISFGLIDILSDTILMKTLPISKNEALFIPEAICISFHYFYLIIDTFNLSS